MNSNIPNSSSQINKISPISSGINQSKDRAIVTNPHPNISPVSQVSIFKTEEQKEIVRTNVFEPNNTSSDNYQKFSVVTEVIKRKSKLGRFFKGLTSDTEVLTIDNPLKEINPLKADISVIFSPSKPNSFKFTNPFNGVKSVISFPKL